MNSVIEGAHKHPVTNGCSMPEAWLEIVLEIDAEGTTVVLAVMSVKRTSTC